MSDVLRDVLVHVQDCVDCPCGPKVTAPCTACPDDAEGDAVCWMCEGTKRIQAHSWDLEKIRVSVAQKGLVPAGYVIEHQDAT